jgi:SAF domain
MTGRPDMSIDTQPRSGASRRPALPSARSGPPVAEALPRLPSRRNPRWIALGVVALCLGALLSYVIYARVASETTVVAAARTVYRGQVLERADLTTLRLRGGTLPDTVAADDLERLVGQRAVFDLPSGAVVAGAAVAPSALPAEGRAAVGLKLASGRAPESLLLPSSPVRLVALPPASTDAAVQDRLAGKTYPARVIGHVPGADGVSVLLDVDVDQAQAPTIALLGAQDRIAVVRDAGR